MKTKKMSLSLSEKVAIDNAMEANKKLIQMSTKNISIDGEHLNDLITDILEEIEDFDLTVTSEKHNLAYKYALNIYNNF